MDQVAAPLDPALFGPGQARDARFVVRDRWAELVNHPQGTAEYRREFLHRQMNEEANVMEQAAQSLVDFPTADWDIRLWLARQCADEARHVQLYLRVMQARGIAIGEYPVINFQYRVLTRIDSLAGRLAVENRTFEADGLDAATFGVEEAQARGEVDMVTLLDTQQADEIVHVGFANSWIRRQIELDPRTLLRMATALSHAAKAFTIAFAGAGGVRYSVADTERREAGFDPGEIAVAAKLSNQKRGIVE
jgi:uncharacterized ferritin-like protein (DUF455 family)